MRGFERKGFTKEPLSIEPVDDLVLALFIQQTRSVLGGWQRDGRIAGLPRILCGVRGPWPLWLFVDAPAGIKSRCCIWQDPVRST